MRATADVGTPGRRAAFSHETSLTTGLFFTSADHCMMQWAGHIQLGPRGIYLSHVQFPTTLSLSGTTHLTFHNLSPRLSSEKPLFLGDSSNIPVRFLDPTQFIALVPSLFSFTTHIHSPFYFFTSSTLRFLDRPSSVLLSAMGLS
jgi:hypothetical protein